MKKPREWPNILAVTLSIAVLALLLFGIPEAVVGNSAAYKRDLVQFIKSEQDPAILRQRFQLELSYLLSSNLIGRYLLFASLTTVAVNSAILLANFVALRRSRSAD